MKIVNIFVLAILLLIFVPGLFSLPVEKQYVSLTVSKLSIDDNANVIGVGVVTYKTKNRIVDVDVDFQIVPNTLRFEMWEMDTKRRTGIVTLGSYIGTISDDLKTIKAVWTTKSSGEQGKLLLMAK